MHALHLWPQRVERSGSTAILLAVECLKPGQHACTADDAGNVGFNNKGSNNFGNGNIGSGNIASGYFLGDINVYKDTYLQYTWVPATKTMTVYTITPPSTYASGHVSVWYVDVYDANNVHIGKSNSVTLTTP
ncbi:hypothetical protein F751_0960 [Auxenochlorella protothecoides]|uniref:Uncharacterized protein n=1 Tax=Auxenochlorella protothecoides TaxID=3075 RepID=A0A087SQZ1_AUXPR|nr:hypothetical protein F751_0960 [Auxenochlorella protothecoides]KFM28145.1 hypothetical protein F751_0960 [Auxenochlorella protothecoides]